MQIDDIEDKIDYIVTEVISPNYKLEDFVQFLASQKENQELNQFLKNSNLSELNRLIDLFKKETPEPEPYDGAARFTEDILKTIDTEKYPVFKQHPYLISEAEKVVEIQEPELEEEVEMEFNANPISPQELEVSDIADISGSVGVVSKEGSLVHPGELDLDLSSIEDVEEQKIEQPVQEKIAEEPIQEEIAVVKEVEEVSEPSIDNIELTVATIQTENLQVMKEKPTVTLIK